MNQVITPQTPEEFDAYYCFRWEMLRKPWQQARGSEVDELEQQSCHRMIVDEKTNQVLAVGRIHFVDQFTAQIRYMAVSEKCQGKGLGRRIIESLEAIAIERGSIIIHLNAREVAQHFYLALGYTLVKKSHLLYGDVQHYLMTKPLNQRSNAHCNLTRKLQQTWHDTIPMSQAMNIQACFYNEHKLITNCDPSFNKNLHNTMFAGSIYTLATLTGWGWMFLSLAKEERQGDIVLADASIKYLKPIAGPGQAVITTEDVKGDLSSMDSGRHGKLQTTVKVYCGDTLCAVFHGKYVAMVKNEKEQA
jgi:thioesterase domain-containing protein